MDIRVIKPMRHPVLPPKPRPRGRFLKFTFSALIIILLLSGVVYTFSSFGPKIGSVFGQTRETTIDIPSGLGHAELAAALGEKMEWGDKEQNEFAATYAEIQWMNFNALSAEIFSEKFGWRNSEQEVFLTESAKYNTPELDFFSGVYMPGVYTIAGEASFAEISNVLVSRVRENASLDIKSFLGEHIAGEKAANINVFVRSETEFLPDLVPLPAQDIRIDRTGAESVLMSFSTTYYNQGKGPLELRADAATKGVRADKERNVFQHIERADGTYRDKIAGVFLWHQEHLHYHFSDFVIYDLEVVDAPGAPDLSGVRSKSTFCVRDVSLVDLELQHRAKEAKFKICGKELQGISVGWGDTYFYSYPDQNLNIVDIPSGRYRLTFIVNPDRKFDEMNYGNNKASVVLDIDMEKLTAKVIEENPRAYPKVKHVYPEQIFN